MTMIARKEGREVKFTTNINPYAKGSVIAEFGNTKVHITAVVEESVPKFQESKNEGWITAEYSMLPSATHTRFKRERKEIGGRTMEIQRLIGRSLRSIIDLKKLGKRSITVDCDVLVADGGTRTTSISGAYVALALAVKKLMEEKLITENPLSGPIAAISVGINKDNQIIADLNYDEDSSCETDMNIVMTSDGRFVEVQGTAEGHPFTRDQLDALLDCAKGALKKVFIKQEEALR